MKKLSEETVELFPAFSVEELEERREYASIAGMDPLSEFKHKCKDKCFGVEEMEPLP